MERKIRHHRSLSAQGIIFLMEGDFKEVLKSRAKFDFPIYEIMSDVFHCMLIFMTGMLSWLAAWSNVQCVCSSRAEFLPHPPTQ